MYPIQEQRWGQVNIHTWQDLSSHFWECFRLALVEVETELEGQGVALECSNTFNEVVTEMKIQGVRVEHSPVIIETITRMVANVVVSQRDYKSDMLKYLPLYERKSKVFNEILNAYDKEFRQVEQSIEIVERNMFLDTAIESLNIYERDLGIKTNKILKYDQRREQISARNRASFEQTTEETIKNVAYAFSNGEVEVNKANTVGLFEVKFVGSRGIPANIEGLKEALDIVIPAHLGLEYTFIGNVWDFVSGMTWGEAGLKTWNGLLMWNGVE